MEWGRAQIGQRAAMGRAAAQEADWSLGQTMVQS